MRRVFICDDAEGYRRLLRAVFESESDIEVVGESCDGAQCIEQVPALDPDVVLLDINMPGLGGLEALPALLEAAPQTHVVVLTSASPPEAELAAMQAGAHAFIQKPNNVMKLPDELRERLAVLDRRAAPRSV
jgi:two-component system nitrate/nitrite response regulator NarL